MRIGLVRADSGFCTQRMIEELECRQFSCIMTAALRAPVRTLCRHDDSVWTPTEVSGLALQEVAHEGARQIIVRQRVAERPHAGGKQQIEVPGYKFQALRTNLSASVNALAV